MFLAEGALTMSALLRDLRLALRTLLRTPGFSLVAVLALGIGLCANTVVFGVIRGTLLRPLSYPHPDELVDLRETEPWRNGGVGTTSYLNYQDWVAQGPDFQSLTAYCYEGLTLTGAGEPERLTALATTANLFETVGVRPRLGRSFAKGEDQAGAAPVAVLSDALYRRRFRADPAVVGRTIEIDKTRFTVIGVMPAGFHFPVDDTDVELWLPLGADPSQAPHLGQRGSKSLVGVGRLKPGVTVAAAAAHMHLVASRLGTQYPDQNRGADIRVRSLLDATVGDIRPALLVLMAAVALVLVIASANVGNLLLVRGLARQKETALRLALGAGRRHLIRQHLSESLLLAVGGAALGLVLSLWGLDALVALGADSIPRTSEIKVDGVVIGFTTLVCLAVGVGCGLVPALTSSGPALREALSECGARTTAGGRRHRLQSALVVSQVALSLVLLLSAGLLLRSFRAALASERGFSADRVLTYSIGLADGKYSVAEKKAFYGRLTERARSLPGVAHAALASPLPLTHSTYGTNVRLEGLKPPPGEDFEVNEFFVSSDYFETLGVPVHAGRTFTEADLAAPGTPVAIVSEGVVHRFYGGKSPVGRRIGWRGDDWMTIVGVVPDVRLRDLEGPPDPQVYFLYPMALQPKFLQMRLAIRPIGSPATIDAAVQRLLRESDPDLPVKPGKTMAAFVDEAVADRRFTLTLLGSFASLAFILAAIGIYGVVSFSVRTRTREIGIRMAFGADARQVVWLVVARGLRLALCGVAVGLLLSLGVARLLGGLLYGIRPHDPLTLVSISLGLPLLAALASYLPARRATRITPLSALRSE
jgi:putative ABC transport system permease protein